MTIPRHFGVLQNNGIDEEWYQRTVAFNHQGEHSNSFLLSVPFDIGEGRPTEVTIIITIIIITIIIIVR